MTRRRSNYEQSCWKERTSLELALIGFVIAAVIFSIALVILLTVKIPSTTPNICKTTECISESRKISHRIDYSINPCDDFYKFSCGNFLKDAHGDEKLGAFLSVQEEVQRQLIELYGEPIKPGEHHVVTMAKRLFRACMDENAIDQDGLKSIKEVLRLLGGWPVVEGFWDETKFDWLEATYRIRELGFPFSIFLDLLVIPDPRDTNKYIFEVAIPVERHFFSATDFERIEFMKNIAIMFGANPKHALSEITKSIEFAQEMHRRNYSTTHVEKQYRRFTINELHKKFGHYMNWFQFVNKIAGPAARISANNFVVFPQADILNNWFYLLSMTPKRTQANYMMWKLIEEIIPFFPELRQRKIHQTLIPHLIESDENRFEFCLRETQERFSPSPMNIMYARKYLTNEKKKQIEDMVVYIKNKFLEVLNSIDWMDENDKYITVEKAKVMKIIIGAPEDYLDDKILDKLNVDMKEIDDYSFLTLLAQANRNHKSNIYQKVNQPRSLTKLKQWFSGTLSDFLLYDVKDNVMRIPVTMLQGIFFNENRPKYLNYGAIGTAIGYEFGSLFSDEAIRFDKNGNRISGWSNQTREAFKEKIKCTILDLEYYKLKKNSFLPMLEVRQTLALKLSYDAYKKWVYDNGEEAELVGSKYSQNQLFWISSAFITCQPTNFYDTIFEISEESDYFSFLVFGPMRNNLDFAEDFYCPAGSRMNPKDKCKLF